MLFDLAFCALAQLTALSIPTFEGALCAFLFPLLRAAGPIRFLSIWPLIGLIGSYFAASQAGMLISLLCLGLSSPLYKPLPFKLPIPFFLSFIVAGLSFFLFRADSTPWFVIGIIGGLFIRCEMSYALLSCALFDWLGLAPLLGASYGALIRHFPKTRSASIAISIGWAAGQIAFHLSPITPAAPFLGLLFPLSALTAYYLSYDWSFAR